MSADTSTELNAETTAPTLELRSVSKAYAARGSGAEPHLAVADLSLSIAPGETVAVVGESGSGKTTAGMMSAGLLAPTSGQVLFQGKEIRAERSRRSSNSWFRQRIQVVFQDPYASLNPRHSVESIIGEPLVVAGSLSKAQRKERVDELIDAVTLPRRCRTMLPHELSGGLRQRVSIAAALACDPALLIADEPVSALDVSVQAEIIDLLVTIQQTTGISIMFITHDLGVVTEIAHRVVVMSVGRLVESGPTAQVYHSPQTDYVRTLLASVLPVGFEEANQDSPAERRAKTFGRDIP